LAGQARLVFGDGGQQAGGQGFAFGVVGVDVGDDFDDIDSQSGLQLAQRVDDLGVAGPAFAAPFGE